MEKKLRFYVDLLEKETDRLCIHGWAVGAGEVALSLRDARGDEIEVQTDRFCRPDVNALLHLEEDYKAGYQIILPLIRADGKPWRRLTVTADDGARTVRKTVFLHLTELMGGRALRGLIDRFPARLRPAPHYRTFRDMGLFGERRDDKREQLTYEEYRRAAAPSAEELDGQRREKFAHAPLISVAVPLYNTPIPYLEALLDSLAAQTYANFEVCLADGSEDDRVEEYIRGAQQKDSRIRYKRLRENLGISENTNAALALARGEFVMLADHDDLVAENALYEIVKEINAHPDADFIYTDEDKTDAEGLYYREPNFKPDFNLYLLRSNNYICHITAVKKELADAVGGFRSRFDGAQDYDFILRCCERAKQIRHIPKVLYHWRRGPQSTAGDYGNKDYAQRAGQLALKEHYRRLGIEAHPWPMELPGRYRTVFGVRPDDRPMISVIIPNRDHAEDLERCLESVAENTRWENYEILVVENGSEQSETFALYEQIKTRYANVRVLEYREEFNFSALNNFAAAQAAGEYLLFLNNDTEAVQSGWMRTLLEYCRQEDVGAAGAKLLYPDGTIQHAGVVLGLGGYAGHIFAGMPAEQPGYMARAVTAQNVSAVTAACMMTKREVFERVRGFDERFTVAFNDVDYCLKVQKAGKKVVYVPDAQLIHRESRTRGPEDTQEKRERFAREGALLSVKWGGILADDPYYNRNLTRQRGNCSFRIAD